MEVVMQRDSAVIRLPSELCRLREADRLIDRWLAIQAISCAPERVAALFEWRLEMRVFSERFGVSIK